MNAGAAVAYLRKRGPLTQAALGERLGGLTQRRISQIEKGPDMKLSTLVDVARALGVTPYWLLTLALSDDPARPGLVGLQAAFNDAYRLHYSDRANWAKCSECGRQSFMVDGLLGLCVLCIDKDKNGPAE